MRRVQNGCLDLRRRAFALDGQVSLEWSMSTHLRRGCWVPTGLSRWVRCSGPQGSGRGRNSINPIETLSELSYSPFTSSKLYEGLQERKQ